MVNSFLNRFAPIDFTRYIDRLTDRFTGRKWLFEKHIEPWLENGNEQFYLLTGEPGVGKSAIVAELIKRWQTQSGDEEQGKIAAYHFCRAGDVETVRPGRVLRSIAAQLGKTLPHYGKALNKVLEQVHLNINVNIDIDTLSNSKVTGIYIENLKDLDPREELRLLIQAPLAEIPKIYKDLPEKERAKLPALKVFLIDSLDEAVTTTGRDNVATLLAALSQANDLPPWIRFILTARPDSHALQGFESVQPYKLKKLLTENLEDIEQYVHKRVQEDIQRPKIFLAFWWKWYWELEKEQLADDEKLNLWFVSLIYHLITRSTQPRFNLQFRLDQAKLSTKTLVNEVKKLSEGNFLYTRLVMDGIGTGELSLKNLSALPKNLYEVYQRFLRHRCSVRKWINLYQPLLGTLTVTQEAISSAQLAKFAKVASNQVESVPQVEGAIAILQQFLDEVENDEGQKLYTLFHQSLREYLLDKKHNQDFWCDDKEQHENIIEYCKEKSKDWEDLRAIDLYGLRHLAQHLVKGDQVEELHRLLSLEKNGRNAWFDTKDSIAETAGFLADVELAWTQADEVFSHEPERSIGLQYRYALINASINSMGRIPPELLVVLVQQPNPYWKAAKALAYTRQIPDYKEKCLNLTILAEQLPITEPLRQQVLEFALQSTQAIENESDRTEALIKLSNTLPSDLFLKALEITQAIADEHRRTEALIKLSNTLPSDIFLKALEITQAITDEQCRAKVLSALLSNTLPSYLFLKALEITQAITDEKSRAEVLGIIATQLTLDLIPQVLDAAQAIKDDYYSFEVLIVIKDKLALDLCQTSKHAQTSVCTKHESEVLAAIANRFPKAISKALDMAVIRRQTQPLALENLINGLPPNLLPQILEAALTIQYEEQRAEVLTALVDKVPEALPHALRAALSVKNERSRAGALRVVSGKLPPNLLTEVLESTLNIRDGSDRALVLDKLVDKLPLNFLPQALNSAQAIEDNVYRARLLTALANRLPEVLPQALEAALPKQDGYASRTYDLKNLSDTLADELLPQAIEIVLHFKDKQWNAYILLFHLVERFPKLLPKVLENILNISNGRKRAWALKMLVDKLPSEYFFKALKAAQAIRQPKERAEVLTALGSKIPEALPVALETILNIKDESHRADQLGILASVCDLPPDLLPKAVESALLIQNEYHRTRVLNALVKQLPKAISQVLKVAQVIKDDEYCTQVLKSLYKQTPPLQNYLFPKEIQVIQADNKFDLSKILVLGLSKQDLVDFFEAWTNFSQALQAITWHTLTILKFVLFADKVPNALCNALFSIQDIQSSFWRAKALKMLTNKLSSGLIPQALQTAQVIETEDYRGEVLVALVDKFPETLPKVLNAIHTMEYEIYRAEVLVNLVDSLTLDILPEAIKIADSLERRDYRSEVLVALATRFPKVFPYAIEASQATEYEVYRTKPLLALVPKLPPALLLKAIEASYTIRDKIYRAEVLATLADKFPEVLPQALEATYTIPDEKELAKILAALANKLTPDLVPQALEVARSLHNESARNIALKAVIPQLKKVLNRFELWKDLLHFMASRTRQELLSTMALLTPELLDLGGKGAAAESTQSIQDITKWWP